MQRGPHGLWCSLSRVWVGHGFSRAVKILFSTRLQPLRDANFKTAPLRTLASIEIGATQIEAAFAANHFAAVSAQRGRAVGTDRGYILLRIRRDDVRKNAARKNALRSFTRSGRNLGARRTPSRIECRAHVRCCSTDRVARKHERLRKPVCIKVREVAPGLLDKPTTEALL